MEKKQILVFWHLLLRLCKGRDGRIKGIKNFISSLFMVYGDNTYLCRVYVLSNQTLKLLALNCRLENELDAPLPLQLESLPLSRDILRTFPTVGTILRVIVDQGREKLSLHLLKVGKWVRFLKIIFEVHAGLWRGLLTPSTKLRYTPDEDSLVSKRQRLFLFSVHTS